MFQDSRKRSQCPRNGGIGSVFSGGWLICILLKRELYIKGSSALGFDSCWPLKTQVAVEGLARCEKRDISMFPFCFFVFSLLLPPLVYFLDTFPFDCTETCMQTTCGCVCVRRCTPVTGLVCPRVWRRGRERRGVGERSICVFFVTFL